MTIEKGKRIQAIMGRLDVLKEFDGKVLRLADMSIKHPEYSLKIMLFHPNNNEAVWEVVPEKIKDFLLSGIREWGIDYYDALTLELTEIDAE